MTVTLRMGRSHRLNLNYGQQIITPTADTMFITATGALTIDQGQWLCPSSSGTLPVKSSPTFQGDGVQVASPVIGTVSDAIAYLDTPAPTGGLTFTLYVANNPTPVTLTIVETDTSGYVTAITSAVNAGDSIVWKLNGGLTGYSGNISISVQFKT